VDPVRPIRQQLPHVAANRLGGQSVLAFGLKLWGAVASFALNWLIARTSDRPEAASSVSR
jgi:hypothetical protein